MRQDSTPSTVPYCESSGSHQDLIAEKYRTFLAKPESLVCSKSQSSVLPTNVDRSETYNEDSEYQENHHHHDLPRKDLASDEILNKQEDEISKFNDKSQVRISNEVNEGVLNTENLHSKDSTDTKSSTNHEGTVLEHSQSSVPPKPLRSKKKPVVPGLPISDVDNLEQKISKVRSTEASTHLAKNAIIPDLPTGHHEDNVPRTNLVSLSLPGGSHEAAHLETEIDPALPSESVLTEKLSMGDEILSNQSTRRKNSPLLPFCRDEVLEEKDSELMQDAGQTSSKETKAQQSFILSKRYRRGKASRKSGTSEVTSLEPSGPSILSDSPSTEPTSPNFEGYIIQAKNPVQIRNQSRPKSQYNPLGNESVNLIESSSQLDLYNYSEALHSKALEDAQHTDNIISPSARNLRPRASSFPSPSKSLGSKSSVSKRRNKIPLREREEVASATYKAEIDDVPQSPGSPSTPTKSPFRNSKFSVPSARKVIFILAGLVLPSLPDMLLL